MQAECPNCHTLFRVTEAQLDMAKGMVRCGLCKKVFNARAKNESGNNDNQPGVIEKSGHGDNLQQAADHTEKEPKPNSLYSGDEIELAADELSAFQHARSYSTAATIAWSLAILALIASLAAEYIWFNQPELLQHQRLKPLTAKLCELTDCAHLQKRDPSLIEMISRNVYTHPNEKNALMVSTTLVNHASYAQPYPDVQIDFSNVRGELVASRRFHPDEYLRLESENADLFQSGTPVAFGLEIRDPGKEAITYEFSFH